MTYTLDKFAVCCISLASTPYALRPTLKKHKYLHNPKNYRTFAGGNVLKSVII